MDKKSIHYGLFIIFMIVSLTILIVNVILAVYNAHYKEKFDEYWSGEEADNLRTSYNNIFDVCLTISSISAALGFIIAGIRYLLGDSDGSLSKTSSEGDIVLFERPKFIDTSMVSTPMTPQPGPSYA
ncbi:uncharacterized LOC118072386 [Chelonus insularis]|uniref:uncharacterized LOC118072386 n=1 Tax=Chelonus insularis TaxID=460826 RepID=UPI00158CE9EC|nr:uncharacterized LOC118072386 [Chelonus insularis]KAG8148306.1 BVpp19-like protein [Chelonus insularis]